MPKKNPNRGEFWKNNYERVVFTELTSLANLGDRSHSFYYHVSYIYCFCYLDYLE